MAAIYYEIDGAPLEVLGLQGCNVCDAAILCAERIADEHGCDVTLDDDDGRWAVHPKRGDGSREPADPIGGQDDGEDEEGDESRVDDYLSATIYEQGNGFPDVDDYVPGFDGDGGSYLYRVVSIDSRIMTGSHMGNHVLATVEQVEWDECAEEDEFPAKVVIEDEEVAS